MSTDSIIVLLIAERNKLDRAIEALGGTKRALPPAVAAPAVQASETGKKRHVSAAARRRMALGQKKRWAALKAAKK